MVYMRAPKISVCIVTYNQEDYIRKCVESVLSQDVSFDYEIIIGDDCSTDGTSSIIREFELNYPGKIIVVSHKKNVGPINNYFSVHNLARGQYVCHMDGDDYALPGKLKALNDFLDTNEECRIVWHRMIILNQNGDTAVGMPVIPLSYLLGIKQFYLPDLALFYGITGCHSGSMYRKKAKKLSSYPFPTIDYYITLTFVQDGGYAAYIDEPLGVYRFFKQDMTLTRQKGNMYVGLAKLDLIERMLTDAPFLNKEFAAQICSEIIIRTYLRHPLKWRFIKLFFKCKTLPRFGDLRTIWKAFNATRYKNLEAAFRNKNNDYNI
jgi:glycosyltransferase involved in cell wall biosynthesis